MVDRPILSCAPTVRALLEGRKTQMRRLVKGTAFAWLEAGMTPAFVAGRGNVAVLRFAVGDRLWVREACVPRYFEGGGTAYRADWTGESADVVPEPRWKPSIHMPRWASRITLTVTEVRVQRVQEISEEDARAEGCRPDDASFHANQLERAREMFSRRWDSVHGAGAWGANPWVVALTFTVARRNIGADAQP